MGGVSHRPPPPPVGEVTLERVGPDFQVVVDPVIAVESVEIRFRLHQTGARDIEWAETLTPEAGASITRVVSPPSTARADAESPVWLIATARLITGGRTHEIRSNALVVAGEEPTATARAIAGVQVLDKPTVWTADEVAGVEWGVEVDDVR